jgi:hypothetical protein
MNDAFWQGQHFFFFKISKLAQCTMVNVYFVVNTTNEGLLYQWYAFDNKLHVSAIRWPSSGF